ncbi:Biopolymer transport protein ExbD/TolR [hydrothermal vent metagenome]|uniref:Biopolymer transport protein ExbD/TolR n=1 Tax=hydrothermal vent metagenome TaxID=652676 RepID=A0A1W1D467_9ZZZZ
MKIKKFDSINVVPFIDIMLVLLVIVLTTATFVAKGIIPIDLSEGKSAKKLHKTQTLTITIKKDGTIYFNKEPILKQTLDKQLKKYKIDTAISINCDKNAKFDNFVYVIDILKQKGYKNLGILTKYE